MIIKSLSVKTNAGTGRLLKYIFQKKKHGKREPIVIKKNLRGKDIEKWSKEFERTQSLRIHPRKNAVHAFHTVISLNALDRQFITDKTLKDIATKYMELRGNDNLFIGTVHYDKINTIHIHLVMSGNKLSGENNRLSREKFAELKKNMQDFQLVRFPNLVHSLPHHGRGKATKEAQVNRQNGRTSQKELLLQSLQTTYSKSKSLDEFLTGLRSVGHEPYYRSGKLTGVKFEPDGLKFRFSRLSDYKEKIDKLEAIQLKAEKELIELSEIRDRQSAERDIDERDSRSFEKEPEKEDEDRRNLSDENESDDHKNEDDEEEIDDCDDMK